MTISVGKYSFDAWLRKGIGLRINEVDTLGTSNGTVKERATVTVDVDVNSTPVGKQFALLGPGDLAGLITDGIVRTEPRVGVTDQEPNYLPFVEFYEEDLLWRYTPAKAAGAKLRPWLALVVLKEKTPSEPGEFAFEDHRLPLPVVKVTAPGVLPHLEQSWAWAHVHVNEAFEDETEFERFLETLEVKDHPNSDRIICRLACPRRLEKNTAYTAFVVPAFETGRLAGLDPTADTSGILAQQPAWSAGAGSAELPVYYRWSFRTGEDEDFESLVRKLEPWPCDPRVGIRDMDGEKPGWGLTEGTDIGLIEPPADAPPGTKVKQSVVGLEGALKAPESQSRPPAVEPTRPFFGELETALNLPQQMRETGSGEELLPPVVSPPIYGEHHALRQTVDTSRGDWLDDLNRDPRHRVPAGFGTRVIQKGQEGYVARAWAQVQKVMEANTRIRLVNWAMRVGQAQQTNLAAGMATTSKLIFFSPLLGKVRGSPTTLRGQLDESTLPAAALSGAMRRLLRPRGPVGGRLTAADSSFSHAALVEGMAAGQLTAAPPKPVPGDLVTDQSAGAGAGAGGLGGLIAKLAGRLRLLLALLLALLIVFLVLAIVGAWLIGLLILLIGALLGVAWVIATTLPSEAAGAGIADPAEAAAAVAASPPQPGFKLEETEPAATAFDPGPPGADSLEGADFRAAAKALERRLAIRAPQSEPHPFDLDNAGKKLSHAIDPLFAFPLLLTSQVQFPFDPDWLLEPEHLIPAMAYPDFDDPMYEGLRDISSDLLLPNIELIPQNSITLLDTNPPFIESYMVGLNCEFGKELLWREYPTDERGSYFRQFWDVKGIIAVAPHESAAEISERSKDIVPIDTWPPTSVLGNHPNPKRGAGEKLVLAVRGELLRKYPALIYAQKAHLYHDKDGKAVPSHPPVLGEVATDADIKREIKFPIFKGQVDPDIRFFGFDLNDKEAFGAEHPQGEADDWGYYFVIQQLPSEPRFGMDITYEPDDDPSTPITWDDLAWDHYPAAEPFIDPGVGPENFHPAGPGESLGEWGTDAARMASILFQRPVMIAVHAKEMLEGLEVPK
ncbi:MAG TPA: hypothetical protein VJL81_02640 [Solirubrobacterales bacterium]|nr:hypothetical protein [Solirubrobacterales bacterium]